MNNLVDENQDSVIQGRSMIHNVLICHDLLKQYYGKTYTKCLVKIDLKKAYDMVDWEFLEKVMMGFEFPEIFVRLVMTYVTSTSFSIKVNRESNGLFEGRRRLRQGDPTSPFLLVLVMEYLTKSIRT